MRAKPALCAFLDAVLHRRVTLLGRGEAHRLRQLRLLAEILELESLQVILERLHEPHRRFDLAKLALDDAERSAEAVRTARTNVHLLDDRAVPPPLRDQLRIRPDGEDVRARRVEDSLDPDLELARGGDGRVASLSSPPSSRAQRSSSRLRRSASSARRRSATWRLRRGSPLSSKPRVAYLDLNFSALLKKQTTLPSLAYAGIPYQVFGVDPVRLP